MSSVASPENAEWTWRSVLYHWSAPAPDGIPSAVARAMAGTISQLRGLRLAMVRPLIRRIIGPFASPGGITAPMASYRENVRGRAFLSRARIPDEYRPVI